jgi:hypothetical protein
MLRITQMYLKYPYLGNSKNGIDGTNLLDIRCLHWAILSTVLKTQTCDPD